MTDQATEVASQDAGNLDVQGGDPAKGSAAGNPSFLESIPEEYRDAISNSGFTDLAALAKGYANANKTLQTTQRFPGSEDVEKLKAFIDKTKPGSVEAYPDPDLAKFPEDLPFDQGSYDKFKELAFEQGLHPHQFEGVVQGFLPFIQQQGADAQAVLDAKADAAAGEIAEKFGGNNSETFIEAMATVNKLYEQNAEIKGYLQKLGAISPEGEVRDANAFFLLHSLASGAGLGTAKLDGAGTGNGVDWFDPVKGVVTDWTKAAQVAKADPEAYRRIVGKS